MLADQVDRSGERDSNDVLPACQVRMHKVAASCARGVGEFACNARAKPIPQRNGQTMWSGRTNAVAASAVRALS